MKGDRPLPYVYQLIHKSTGRFYIGHRRKNVQLGLKSENDLWIKYFSSSKQVELANRDDFEATVVAEFFDPESAIRFEQTLINAAWGNPLLINRSKVNGERYDKLVLCATGVIPGSETRAKMSKAHKGRPRTEEWRRNLSKAITGKKIIRSEESKLRYKESRSKYIVTEETKKKLSESQQKRFKSPEQRESNRRASIIGYKNRKIKPLHVTYPDGREMTFKHLLDFLPSVSVQKHCVYRHAKSHSGRRVEKGPLEGYIFRWAA